MLSYFLPIFIATLLIALSVGRPYWREYQRNKIRQKPFKKEWRLVLQKRMPYFRKMPSDLQLQLKQHIQVFLAEKRFVGCNGVVITDEIKVTVAAQACLLLLNRKTNYYPKLTTILVYPAAFIKEQQRVDFAGVQSSVRATLAGESWEFGKVVLSWEDAVEGAKIIDDGRNVVIHEFAHQLDQENGQANGAPILGKGQTYAQWSSVFNEHFEKLKHDLHLGVPTLFDSYGATNPAEFFAVVSEVFFELPQQLHYEAPALYQQLRAYYHVDPIHWN